MMRARSTPSYSSTVALVHRAALLVATFCCGLSLAAPTAQAWEPLDRCAPTWDLRGGANPWHLNEAGYSRVPITELEAILTESWVEWERPCCSDWRSTYAGRTNGNPINNRDSRHIIGFEESQWPAQLGDARFTLAVTLPAWTRTCLLVSADMLFNAARHTFTTTGRGGTDLQAIATHEAGHWLGLGHSAVRQATMFESYSGGTSQRNLHPDDVDGVCSLYPGDCGCTSDADCSRAGEVCLDGTCQRPPCGSDADCATGLVCDRGTGDCVVPPCVSDGDCPSGRVCREGTCRLPSGQCSVCQPCSRIEECGGTGICSPVRPGGQAVCVVACGPNNECPGDSQCFATLGGASYCLNPDAASGQICPPTYVCGDGNPCAGVTCPPGQVCDSRTGRCTGADHGDGCDVCEPCESDAACNGGVCARFSASGPGYCTQVCGADGACPGLSECFSVQSQQGMVRLCFNPGAERDICPAGFRCEPASSDCPAGQVQDPVSGRCVPDNGTTPPDGQPACPICKRCEFDADCGAAAVCRGLNGNRVCTALCESNADCPGDAACWDIGGQSLCLNPDASDAICPASYTCAERRELDPDDLEQGRVCAVCEGCSGDAQCGPGGVCRTVGGNRICTQECNDGQGCPGDSVCWPIGDSAFCLNPAADTAGICPATYQCRIPTLGEPGDGSASGGSDGCEGCAATRSGGSALWGMLVLLALLYRRRRV